MKPSTEEKVRVAGFWGYVGSFVAAMGPQFLFVGILMGVCYSLTLPFRIVDFIQDKD